MSGKIAYLASMMLCNVCSPGLSLVLTALKEVTVLFLFFPLLSARQCKDCEVSPHNLTTPLYQKKNPIKQEISVFLEMFLICQMLRFTQKFYARFPK